MKEFFGSMVVLFVEVDDVVLIWLRELWKARTTGHKGLMYALVMTWAAIVVATTVVLYSLEI